VAGAAVLYLPWFTSFSSQAGGVLSSLLFPTRIQQFFVMFGVALVPILVWLIWLARNGSGWRRDLLWKVGLGVPLGLLAVSLLVAGIALLATRNDPLGLEAILGSLGIRGLSLQEGLRHAAETAFFRRLGGSWTALVLGGTLAMTFGLLAGWVRSSARKAEPRQFVMILVALGALLILTPEFLYLRDLFGTRMNTVFKFYFAAWILWGLAAAYAAVEMWPRRWAGAEALRAAVLIPLLGGLVYPVLATWTKANGFRPFGGRTLDGTAYLANGAEADYSAIQWINQSLPTGVVAEAIGGSYTQFGRVSAHTGFPTVLGWDGHELQWRGGAGPQGSRMADIQTLYETPDLEAAAAILDRYRIDYVYVGPLEMQTYLRLDARKFDRILVKVYENGGVRIYSRQGAATG
jgi:YYY domain-containing protein